MPRAASYDVRMTKSALPGREYELKFAIGPKGYAAVIAHPLLSDAPCAARALSSTYFDTPDDRLRREHVSLRLREGEAGGTVQTLKQASGSILDRAEWEQRVTGARPDMALLGGTPLKSLLDEVDSTLVPRFTVEVTRDVFPLRRGLDEVEAALDRGTIRADSRALAISELELESKAGQPGAVFDLARDLVRDLPLTLSLESKSERGFAVANRSIGKPVKALALAIDPAITRAAAFEAIVQACLVALTHNAALIAEAEDGEAVHKTRISLRRLRAVLSLFQPSLRRRRLRPLERDIKWAAAALGDARDADVLQEVYVGPAVKAGRIEGAGALAALMSGRRIRAHEALAEALASPRWRLLLVELLAFSLDGVRRTQRKRGWRGFVRRRLREHRRELARGTRRFSRLSTRSLHDVRKSAKTLRYDLELLAPVEGLGGDGRRVDQLAGSLEQLQDTLGILQDEASARAKLREAFAGARRPAGLSRKAWRAATRAVMPRDSGGGTLMRKAGKAARAIGRSVAFR